MATELQRSEIMSGALSSSEFASHTPEQTDFSADAALILAALGRMEAVVRDERAAFDRLRVMLSGMAQAVAKAKAVADSETTANLLNELEHRVDAMLEIAGRGPVTAAAAIPDLQPSSFAAPVEHDAAPPADAADALEQAIQHPAEPDLVPTVSDVVSRLDSDELTPSDTDALVSAPTVAMLTAMVEALRDSISATAPEPEAAVEAPAAQGAEGTGAAEAVAPPSDPASQDLALPAETSSIEIAEVATPAVEIAEAEAAHRTEAPQADEPPAEAVQAIGAAETADIPPPAAARPDNSPILAMLNARLEALNAAAAAAALVPEAAIEASPPAPPDAEAAEVVAQAIELAPPDLTPPPETSSSESAEVATPAMEIVQRAEVAQEIEPPQAIEANHAAAAVHPAEDAASAPRPSVAGVHESALLASLEQMGARPFPPPDEGTAVIFASKPESEFLPEFAREPAAPSEMARSETAPEPEQAIAPPAVMQPSAPEPAALEPTAPAPAETTMAEILSDLTRALAPEPALPAAVEVAAPDVEPTMPIKPAAESAAAPSDAAEIAESDIDPADFLFEPEPEPDPAADLLDPAPPPAPRAKAAVLPGPEFVPPPAKPAAETPEAAQPVEPDQPAQAAPEPAPRDPLKALKAMSENEKIALFS